MAISATLPKSPSSKPIRTTSTSGHPKPFSLSSFVATDDADHSSGQKSVTSRYTTASTRSRLTRKRLAHHKPLTIDKQLHVPRSTMWTHGGTVQSAQTGNHIFALNHFQTETKTRAKAWRRGINDAIISGINPTTRQVGKILAVVREEGIKFAIYTYFPAYEGQKASFVGDEFYKGSMFRYGEMTDNKRRCTFAVATMTADFGRDFVIPVLTATPLPWVRHAHWNLELRDIKSKEVQIVRENEADVVTFRSGMNLLVATCLCFAAETVMTA